MRNMIILLEILIISLLLSVPIYANSFVTCEAGDGTWTEKIGCDPREGETCPQFYCSCEQGAVWNGTSCEKIPDKSLCESSDGEWIKNSCVCPSESIGWTDGFGCDYISQLDANPQPSPISSKPIGFLKWLRDLLFGWI